MLSLLLKNVSFMGFCDKSLKNGMDISIDDQGSVTAIDFHLPQEGYSKIVDLNGLTISPGWIDMHTHVYEKGIDFNVNPDEIGSLAGVTVVVDAGSAGWANFEGFRDSVIKKYKNTIVISFINIGSTGLIGKHLTDLSRFDPDRLYDCIQNNRDYIRGIKHLVSHGFGGWSSEAVKLACKAAVEADLPLMVHVSDAMPLMDDVMPKLRKGDIVTHCFHGRPWGILERGKLIPEAIEARERGVLFDVGHGFGSFNVYVAEQAIAQGFKPDSISTDLHKKSLRWLCCSQALTMSKMLSLGMNLEEVILASSVNPARMIGMDGFEKGVIGKKARFTVFSLEKESMNVLDNYGTGWTIHEMIRPHYTIMEDRAIAVTSPLTGNEKEKCVIDSWKEPLGSPTIGCTWATHY